MDIYSSVIMELATDIRHLDPIDAQDGAPFGKAHKVSKICGSEINLELQLNKEKSQIISFSIVPKACALGQASAAILSKHIIGAEIQEVKSARDSLYAMLKENSEPPKGRFWEIRYLEPVIDYLPRHASVMLAWDAAIAAIDNAIMQ